MIAYTLKCSKCKSTANYHERTGHALYETSDLEGWTWKEGAGNICPSCNFLRITKPVTQRVKQTVLL